MLKKLSINNLWFYFFLFLIFILGIGLRIKLFILNPSLYHDETSLALNILNKNYMDFFKVLDYGHVAPPIFMCLTKFITDIFSINDYTLRILPFIFSILSLPLFYIVSKDIFKNKPVLLFINLAFILNQQLLYYSNIFKQYSSDVFFVLLTVVLFNFLIKESSIFKQFLINLILALMLWISQPAFIFVCAGYFYLFFKSLKEKKLKKYLISIIPIILMSILFLYWYFKFFTNTYNDEFMHRYWANDFMNIFNFFPLIIKYLKYIFQPITYLLMPFLLFIMGFFLSIKTQNLYIKILNLGLIFTIILSFCRIYPFHERLILYLIPVFLIICFLPLEKFFDRKYSRIFIIILLIGTLFNQICTSINLFKLKTMIKLENPRGFIQYIYKNAKPEDIIFVNSPSKSEFLYYSHFYKIKNKVIFENDFLYNQNNAEIRLKNSVSNFKSGEKYWLFMPFEYKHKPTRNAVYLWTKNNSKKIKLIDLVGGPLLYIYVK